MNTAQKEPQKTPKSDNFDNLIEKYQAEMLRFKSMRQPPPPPIVAEPVVKPPELPVLPIAKAPPILAAPPQNTKSQRTASQVSARHQPSSNLDDVGYIQIEVVAAEQAYPIPEAIVTITKVVNGVTILNKIVQTDLNGKAPTVKVPAPSRQLSQRPSNIIPYTTYSITVQSPTYQTVESRNIQVFGGSVAVQVIEMTPLKEYEKPNDTNVVYNTPEHSLVEEEQ